MVIKLTSRLRQSVPKGGLAQQSNKGTRRIRMATGWFRVGYPRVSGLVGSGSGMISHSRFSGSGPRNQSGSVSGLVFHPWISEINHLKFKLMFIIW
jgi:hypothetical protein